MSCSSENCNCKSCENCECNKCDEMVCECGEHTDQS
jgi:hypothetical protein